ncbi:phosphatase PAP2 family protein [Corynebacterium kroppenstedtii]|uniref:phosphatase PAP2 family protein n=1 Tax=Corynebacterium kroppenstedtii TaxID=161879 RepID=UPI001EF59D5D|nr:phosphatase PAP2 family protein [Corynebacterium kroppenstedtii]
MAEGERHASVPSVEPTYEAELSQSPRPATQGPKEFRPILPPFRYMSTKQLRLTRRLAVSAWILGLILWIAFRGWPFGRSSIFIVLTSGLAALSIGRRHFYQLILDWSPFFLFLVAYDKTRTWSLQLGLPVHWHLAPDIDKAMFGVVPTVWVQEQIRFEEPPWWELILAVVYISYFVTPYIMAFGEWLRSRADFARFAAGMLTISFIGLIGYVFVPAAPPWAAGRCAPEDVADGPRSVRCMFVDDHAGEGSILGPVHGKHDDTHPWVERLSARGWEKLNHLSFSAAIAHAEESPSDDETTERSTASQSKTSNLGADSTQSQKNSASSDIAGDTSSNNSQSSSAGESSGIGALIERGQKESNLVAAIPSLHAALTMYLATYSFARRRKKIGVFCLIYAFAMGFTLVFFAEHYVFDILLGWGIAIIVPLVGITLEKWWTRNNLSSRLPWNRDASNSNRELAESLS